MSILETIKADALAARKMKSAPAIAVLSTLLGDLETASKKTGKPVDDIQIISLVKSRISTTQQTAELYRVNHPETAAVLDAEILLYEHYLPLQLTELDIESHIEVLKASLGVEFNLGRVQGFFKKNYPGQYDAQLVSEVFKALGK